MSEKLKSVICWTGYILATIVIIFTIFALGVKVFAPSFFPNTDISGFQDYINTFCVILSFLSVGLGLLSIWQANESNKQTTKMLETINDIKLQQEILAVSLKSQNNQNIVTSNQSEGEWQPDPTKS